MAWNQLPLLVALAAAPEGPAEEPPPLEVSDRVRDMADWAFRPDDLWQLHLSSTPRLRGYRKGARLKIPLGVVTTVLSGAGGLWWGFARQHLRHYKRTRYYTGIAMPAAGVLSGLVLIGWGAHDARRLEKAKWEYFERLSLGLGADATGARVSVGLRF